MSVMPMGNLLRLQPLHIEELPDHPKLRQPANGNTTSSASNRPSLRDFIHRALVEATEFAEKTVSASFASKGEKKSPPSTNPVEVLARTYPKAETNRVNYDDTRMPRLLSGQGEKPAEHWFGRRSCHADYSEDGSANWTEFDRCIRQMHSEYERKYTPGVYDNYEVLNWNNAISEILTKEPVEGVLERYGDIRMSLREMCHQLPFPMSPRTFSVVVITAKGPGSKQLLVVQLPVNIRKLDAALYSNRRNVTESKGRSHLEKTPTVLGIYTSVERCTVLPDLNIEWLMATASDARGWLPMWMQRAAMPSTVIKDVGWFMKFMNQERQRKESMSTPSRSRETSRGR